MTIHLPHPPLPPAEASPFELVLPVLGVMLGLALVIGVFLMVRKRFNGPDEGEATGGFAIGGLRELVRQGKMTQDEFEQAKAGIVAASHRHAAKEAQEKAKSKTPQPPFSVG